LTDSQLYLSHGTINKKAVLSQGTNYYAMLGTCRESLHSLSSSASGVFDILALYESDYYYYYNHRGMQ